MKTLILMRHGQASVFTETDGQRPLTPAGKEQTALTGQKLKQNGFTPQIILCSPLLRARQSAQEAAAAWNLIPQNAIELDGRLSAVGLLQFAQEQFKKYDSIMLVGHNPAISLTAGVLSDRFISFRPADCAVFDITDPNTPKLLFQDLS